MNAANTLKSHLKDLAPKIGLVLGSGLGGLVDAIQNPITIDYADLKGFPEGGVSGHAGKVVAGKLGNHAVIVLSGRIHYYEHGNSAAMRPALEALKAIGVETMIFTNSAGSLHDDMPPGSVMQITDQINFSGLNPLIGEESDARFVGMTSAYDAELAKQFSSAANKADIDLHIGVYIWFSGPSFETPAEIRMAKTLGADAVGMSTVPEVILARFLDMRVAAFSVITNLGAGMTGNELSHDETKEQAPKGGQRLAKILQTAFEGNVE